MHSLDTALFTQVDKQFPRLQMPGVLAVHRPENAHGVQA